VVAAQKVSCIHKIFGNVVPMDEPGLISVDDEGDSRTEAVRHDLSEQFHGAVLKGDRMEGINNLCPLLF
jgi:hypothetical protein